ncbi:hypothetical protein SPRG_05111, partial [Saprolegnia parasitica CBS 223.65]
HGWTPLYIASENGHEAVVGFLLGAQANANQGDYYGTTPLHIAAQNGHETVVQLLLGAGADVNKGMEVRLDAS